MNKKDVMKLLECVKHNCISNRESNNFYRGQIDMLGQVLILLECEGNSKRAKLVDFLDLQTTGKISFNNLPACLMHHFTQRGVVYYLDHDDEISIVFTPDLDEDNCVCYNMDLEGIKDFLEENGYKYEEYEDKEDNGYITLYIKTGE